MPDPALSSCYSSSFVVHTDNTVTFTTTRPLECASGITDKDGNSFVVQLDTDMALCMGWNPDSYQLSYHGSSNHQQFKLNLLSTGGTCTSGGVEPKKNPHDVGYLTHGVFMWVSWAVIGLL